MGSHDWRAFRQSWARPCLKLTSMITAPPLAARSCLSSWQDKNATRVCQPANSDLCPYNRFRSSERPDSHREDRGRTTYNGRRKSHSPYIKSRSYHKTKRPRRWNLLSRTTCDLFGRSGGVDSRWAFSEARCNPGSGAIRVRQRPEHPRDLQTCIPDVVPNRHQLGFHATGRA